MFVVLDIVVVVATRRYGDETHEKLFSVVEILVLVISRVQQRLQNETVVSWCYLVRTH